MREKAPFRCDCAKDCFQGNRLERTGQKPFEFWGTFSRGGGPLVRHQFGTKFSALPLPISILFCETIRGQRSGKIPKIMYSLVDKACQTCAFQCLSAFASLKSGAKLNNITTVEL
jgi:hypothetical protein